MGATIECDFGGCEEIYRGYGRLGGMGLEREAEEKGWMTAKAAWKNDETFGVHFCPRHAKIIRAGTTGAFSIGTCHDFDGNERASGIVY